jgi:hypothetical protein
MNRHDTQFTSIDPVGPAPSTSMARRMFELVEPIGAIPYSTDEPTEAMFALGFTDFWDTYFAGRAAPLGHVPAEVVDALFYNFAPGEVARHIPKVWCTATREAAMAARQIGCTKKLRRILGERVDLPEFARAAELLIKAATSARLEGRPMYAALRAMPIPDDVVARLFHAASLLREHRGDGHIAALMVEGVGGVEAHVLLALDMDMPAEKFGRIHHLPRAQLDAVIDGMRAIRDVTRHAFATQADWGDAEAPSFCSSRSAWRCSAPSVCVSYRQAGTRVGRYLTATAPDRNSWRSTSSSWMRSRRPASNVGQCPASTGCTRNSYSSISPRSANARGSVTPPTNRPSPGSCLSR